MMNQPTTQRAGARFRGLVILWGAQLVSQALFFLVMRLAVSDRGGGDQTLLVALAVAGFSTVSVSFFLKPRLLARAAQLRRPDMVTSAYVVAFALCESCALMGVLARFMTGARASFYFFIPSALGLLLHFPRRRDIDDASGDGGRTFTTTL